MNQLSFRLNVKCVIRYQLLLHRVFLRFLLGAIILVAGIFTWQHDIEAGYTVYYVNFLSFYFILFWRWKLFCYNGKTNQSSILLILEVFVTTFKLIGLLYIGLFFYVLLTVHLSIILAIDQLNAQILVL